MRGSAVSRGSAGGSRRRAAGLAGGAVGQGIGGKGWRLPHPRWQLSQYLDWGTQPAAGQAREAGPSTVWAR